MGSPWSTDGTVVFGGQLQYQSDRGLLNVGTALGSAPAGGQAKLGVCINASEFVSCPTESQSLLGIVALGDGGYAIMAAPGPEGPWELVKIPQ